MLPVGCLELLEMCAISARFGVAALRSGFAYIPTIVIVQRREKWELRSIAQKKVGKFLSPDNQWFVKESCLWVAQSCANG